MSEKVYISSAWFVGACDRCKEPTTGRFDSDDNRSDADEYWAEMKCVNCGHVIQYGIEPYINVERLDEEVVDDNQRP